jgi:hypothetical protein
MLPQSLTKNLTEVRAAIAVDPFFASFLEHALILRRLHAEIVTKSIGQGKYSTRRSIFLPERGVAIDIPEPEELRRDVFNALNKLPPSQTFRVVHRIQGALSSISLTGSLTPLKRLLGELELFERTYEKYLSLSDIMSALEITIVAANLRKSLGEVEDWVSGFIDQLTPPTELPPQYAALSLLFENEQSFDSISAKLRALEELYSDFSELVAVDTRDFPLRIRDLQYGSLWIDIVGNEVVIGLIASAITSSAVFLYRHVRESGKLPRGAQQLEHLLRIREQMKQQGLDTSASDDELQFVFAKISRNLNVLVGEEEVVEVNGKRFSLAEKPTGESLPRGAQLLIESGERSPDN